jgi:hypothetical protein
MFISRLSLPRRAFLRGIGASVALPLLEAMVPAMTATAKTAANARLRFGAVYSPRRHHGSLHAQDRRRRLRIQPDSQAARAAQSTSRS